MIKRPLLWGIGAFIGGILLAWKKVPPPFLMIPAFLDWLLTYLLIYRLKKFLNRKDNFLWILPFLMVLGFLAMKDQMKPPDMDRAFDDKASCKLTGKIDMTVKKPKGCVYYLKDNRVALFGGDKIYSVENIIVFAENSGDYQVGNKITVTGTIYKFSENTNPGGFNELLYYKIRNISYKVYSEKISLTDSGYSKIHKMLNKIKERLANSYMRILPQKEAGIIMAMVLGEKYMLEDEIKNLYQDNGISHILAISGLHISMIGAAVYHILRKMKLGLYVSTVMSLIFIFGYGMLTNFDVSTNRAVVMYSVMLIANLIGKTFDLLSALSLSAFIILLKSPMQIFNAGFLLSFGAVLGIALMVPRFTRLFEAKNSLVSGLYVSIAAQIFTLPVVLYYFFQIPVYSVLINILLVPLASLLLFSSLAAGMAGTVSLPAGIFLAGVANYILRFYETVCRMGLKLPKNLITVGRPDILRIILYFLLVLIFVILTDKTRKKRVMLILAVAVQILLFPKPRDGFTVTFLDVGQGDAIFMETKEGTTFLIDGGSMDVEGVGLYRIKPFLLSRGIDHIDYAIVTHPDTDHVSGLMELIQDPKIKVSNLVLPRINGNKENQEIRNFLDNEGKGTGVDKADMSAGDNYGKLEMLAETYRVNTFYIKAGDYIKEGMLNIACLHPFEEYDYVSDNSYSVVLSVNYGNFDMLLTGDLDAEGEETLVSKLAEKRKTENSKENGIVPSDGYDVLKVAHHGSKYSTGWEFLRMAKPKISVISCGKNNRYGHPHQELKDRLAQIGSEILISYVNGAVTIRTDGVRYRISSWLRM